MIGHDIAAALPELRRHAESMMTDTCTVSFADGETFDEATGRTVTNYTTRFTSKCKVQARNLVARDSDVGGRIVTEVRLELHLPVSAPAVEVDDVVDVTAIGSLSDPQLVGRRFRVIAPVGKSFATARRLDVEEVVS